MSKVLIVEDENIIAIDLKERLCTLGFLVIKTCRSGEETLDLLKEVKPDLILMDIVLGGQLDGIETATIIHKNYQIPVIFLTAYSDPATINRLKDLSPSGYLLKPFRDRELAVVIELALYRSKMEKAMQEKQNELQDLNADLENRVNLRTLELQQEIEERKKIESVLKRNEEIFREMAEFLPLILTETDENFLIRFFNQTGLEKLGYERGSRLPFLSLWELFHPTSQDRARKDISAVLKGEAFPLGHYQIVSKNASTVKILATAAPIYKDGAIRGVRIGMMDIDPLFTSALLPEERFYSHYNLTRQEKIIVNELARGLKNREIAEHLHISDNTLKTHLSNIFSKMNAQSREEVVEKMADYQITHVGRERLVISLLEKVVSNDYL